MPTDAPRRSSTGTRRGPPKPHVPFRGENVDVAKKTGVRVQRAELDSDGFEPFEDVLGQADALTPFQVNGRGKKRKSVLVEEDLDDGGGEEDMDIDSPIRYISNASARQPATTPKATSTRSRPVSRTTDDVYDAIPSPRRGSPRHSNRNGISARPSRLSIQHTEEDYSMDMSMTTNGAGAMDYSDPISQSDAQISSPTQNMTMNGIEEEDDLERTPVGSSRRAPITPTPNTKLLSKGAISRDEDEEMEDDSAQGFDDLDAFDDGPIQEDQEEEEVEEPQASSRAKKIRVEEPQEVVAKKTKVKVQSMKMKENHAEGVRRSQRATYKPLQYWRNEKVVYGRPKTQKGQILVPHIKEIIRIPEDPVEPFSKKRKRSTRSRSRVPAASATPAPHDPDDFPEKGWDDDTSERGLVIDWRTKELVEKRIACLAKNVSPQQANNSEWLFQKIFGDEQFIAAGQLVIPVDARKPNKTTKDNTYVFCILEGAVNVKINDLSRVLCQGSMFMVPRGNQYFIENISKRPARLFFTQARMIADDRLTTSPEKPAKRASTTGVNDTVAAKTTKRAATMGA
ncbi:mitotic fidelity of chromosome transmission-related protein [Paramarasmius palmivorus]|uniref:CENP-C homolog n=1 Tax=Paramarasmius palmivorus TaxID=297713 RepID=A0AAW0DAS2_9AGAR